MTQITARGRKRLDNPNSYMLEHLKKETIDMFKGYLDKGILEEPNVKLLAKLINNADNEEEVLAISALGTNYKRTGLHFDKRLEKIGTDVKYFKKNKALSFVTDKSALNHKLVIGDNYDALLNLLIEYKGAVDIIYIDPPYAKDSLGAFAKTNYNNALTRDNILSMLYVRLILSRQLMSDESVIIVSIDDKNQAYIKCLMDDVFGEVNFIGCLPRVTKKSGKQHSGDISGNHDYLLIYSREKNAGNIKGEANNMEDFEGEDEYVKERGKYRLNQTLDYDSLWYEPNMDFPLYIEGEEFYPGGSKELSEARHKGKHNPKDWVWRWSLEKFEFGLKNGFIVLKQGRNRKRIYTKTYQNAKIEKNRKGYYIKYGARENKLSSLALVENKYEENEFEWDEFVENKYSNDNAKKDLDSVLGSAVFDFPKPISLMGKICSIFDKKDALVLDFFAGSGTTGHAVLEQNRKDGGTRRFILCTNNEVEDGEIAYNVTSKRLKRIMTGFCYDGSHDFAWLRNNTPYGGNLEVVEIDSVSALEKSTGKTAFDVIDERLYGKSFDSFKDKIQWICQEFERTQKLIESDEEWLKRVTKK